MIIALLGVLVAIIGLILLSVLFVQTKTLQTIIGKKDIARSEVGVTELLNYAAAVAPGVIANKNGSLMAAWVYKGEDNASSTEDDRALVSFRINQALTGLGNGWMLHVDALRHVAPGYNSRDVTNYPDRISRAIDEERRFQFEQLGNLYDGYFVLTVTWMPASVSERKFVELMFDDPDKDVDDKTKTRSLLDQFENQCKSIEQKLTCFNLKRLGPVKSKDKSGNTVVHDELLAHLQFCLTGIRQPIALPKSPLYLDALIGGQELFSGIEPRIGTKYVQCVAIEGFPQESTPGILSALAELPVEYRWSSRYIFMDRHEAIAHFNKIRRHWQQKVRGFLSQVFNTANGAIDENALSMVQDVDACIAETNSNLVSQGYYTSVIVLMDSDKEVVKSSALSVQKLITNLGFAARTETINTMQAFLGSLPGHDRENVRRPLINTLNLADLLPISTIWTGKDNAPSPRFEATAPALMHCITSGNNVFRLNLHVGELGHTLLLGMTRGGKTTLLAMIATMFRKYKGARVFCFDKGLGMYPMCSAVGGLHIDLGGSDNKLAFAPLSDISCAVKRNRALEWLRVLLKLNDVEITPAQNNEMATALNLMHSSGSKTLSDFINTIQDNKIREALATYRIDGSMGSLFDADEDNLNLSDFVTFEIDALMKMGSRIVIPVLLYIFWRIEESLDGNPTLIVLDEAWLMLGHAVFKEKIHDWLNTLAKANASVVLATQNLSAITESGISEAINSATATKIFLANPQAKTPSASSLYQQFGLNDQEIEMIAHATPRRDYYYTSQEGRRMFSMDLSPLALAFSCSGDKESLAKIKSLQDQYGDSWVEEWVAYKNLNLQDYEVCA